VHDKEDPLVYQLSGEKVMSADEINPWGASLDKFKEWDPQGSGADAGNL
jgi:hypothetical protein